MQVDTSGELTETESLEWENHFSPKTLRMLYLLILMWPEPKRTADSRYFGAGTSIVNCLLPILPLKTRKKHDDCTRLTHSPMDVRSVSYLYGALYGLFNILDAISDCFERNRI